MKKLLLIGLFTATFSTAVFAADNSAQAPATSTTNSTTTTATTTTTAKKPMSVSNLLQQLQKAGYIVSQVSYDKDNAKYKVDAIDRHGDKQSLDLDAAVGLTPDQRKVPHEISIAQAAKKVEKDGAYIKDIEYDSGSFKVTVVDKQGNEQAYTVDAKSGKVTKS